MSTEPLLTDEELIHEVMNGGNADDGDDDEENDDGDDVLGAICPKVVMFRMHCKYYVTTCPSA